jgi:hypothetical protein
MTDHPMPDRIEPHWWGIILAAVAGFLGWRIKSAQDAVRLERLSTDLDAVRARLAALENGSVTTASTLARVDERLTGIGRTLDRIEQALDKKADKA